MMEVWLGGWSREREGKAVMMNYTTVTGRIRIVVRMEWIYVALL